MPSRPLLLPKKTQQSVAAIADRCEIELLELALAQNADDFEVLARLGELYSRVGRLAEGLAIDIRLVGMAPRDPIVHYNLACSLALTRQSDAALTALSEAIRLGYNDLDHLLDDADLRSLHGIAGFRELLALLGHQESPT